MNTYEQRVDHEVVERVTNIRPGSLRDRELAALVVTDGRRTRDGWYLVGIDGDAGDGEPAAQGTEPMPLVDVDAVRAHVERLEQAHDSAGVAGDEQADPAEQAEQGAQHDATSD